MMDGMLAKGKQEKHEEEVEFTKFHEWCNQVRDEKTTSIAEATAQIEELAAAIDKAESDAEVLAEEIANLDRSKWVSSRVMRSTSCKFPTFAAAWMYLKWTPVSSVLRSTAPR